MNLQALTLLPVASGFRAASSQQSVTRLQADHAVVVLGRPARPDGTAGEGLRRRLEAALAVAREDPQAVLVLSGGSVANAVVEAEAMARWLVGQGVRPERIVVEPEARYTLDNARKVRPIVERMGASKITLVTERFHLPRAAALLRAELSAHGVEAEVLGRGAPDGLSGEALETRMRDERRKLYRDRHTQRGRKLGFFPFDPARVSRRALGIGASQAA